MIRVWQISWSAKSDLSSVQKWFSKISKVCGSQLWFFKIKFNIVEKRELENPSKLDSEEELKKYNSKIVTDVNLQISDFIKVFKKIKQPDYNSRNPMDVDSKVLSLFYYGKLQHVFNMKIDLNYFCFYKCWQINRFYIATNFYC